MQVNRVFGYNRRFTRKVFETENYNLERIRMYSEGKLSNTLLVNSPKGMEEQLIEYLKTGTQIIKRFKEGKMFSKTVLVGEGNKRAENIFYHTTFDKDGGKRIQKHLDTKDASSNSSDIIFPHNVQIYNA